MRMKLRVQLLAAAARDRSSCWAAVAAAPSADAVAGDSRVASGASGAARVLWDDRRDRRKRHHAAATWTGPDEEEAG